MNAVEINVRNAAGTTIGKLDLGEAEVNIVYQIADIREPDRKQGDYSFPFTVPGTKNNNIIFQHIFENGFSSFEYNPNKKLDAQILINGNQFFNGDLQLNQISKEDNKIVEYEITIYGKIPSFFDDLGEFDLKDLIDLSDFNHQYTRLNVVNSWETSIIQNNTTKTFNLGDGYVYPMEWRGQNNPAMWKVEDFKPAIYAKTIFDRIFQTQGYTYQSNFLNSTTFKRVILPYAGDDQIELTEDEIKLLEVWAKAPAPPNRPVLASAGSLTGQNYNNVPIVFTDDTNSPAKDFGNNYNTSTGILTIPKNGKFTLTTTVAMTAEFTGLDLDNGTQYSTLRLYGGPIEGVLKIVNVDTNTTLASTAFTFNCPEINGQVQQVPVVSQIQTVNVSYTGLFAAGKRYKVFLDWRTTGSNYTYKTQAPGFGGIYYQRNTKIEIRMQTVPLGQSYNAFSAPRFILTLIEKNVAEGDDLKMEWFIPDMKALDFVNEITKLFNLYWTKTGDKSFKIEPRNDFYNPNDIRDWTYKLDNNETVNIQPLYDLTSKRYLFQYSEDSDYYNEDYYEVYEQVYGTKELTIENDFVTDAVEITSSFAATPMVQYLSTDRILPTYVKEENAQMLSMKPKLRVLFYGGYLPTLNSWNLKNPYTNVVIVPAFNKYPYAGHFDNPTNPVNDLNWAMSKKYYYQWQNISNGNLFNTYWRDHIDEIVDKNNHLLTARVILNDYDIINFDLRALIQVDNVYYRVNKLTFNPLTSEAEVELFRAKNYIRRQVSSITPTAGLNNGVAGLGTFPKPLVFAYEFKDASGLPITTRTTFVSLETERLSRDVQPPTQQERAAIYNISGQSWGDKKPYSSWYPTQNRDVNNNFYSPQAAQRVVGENNYVDPSAFAVEVRGTGNVVMGDTKNIAITGENNVVMPGLKNITIVGDGQTITTSDTSYINGIAVEQTTGRPPLQPITTTKQILMSPRYTGMDVGVGLGGRNSVLSSRKING